MVAAIAQRNWRARLMSCAWLVCAILLVVAVRVTPVNAQGATPQAAEPPPLSKEQLEQVVAPIALYPDDLLSQVLMASTYPLEVVQAARWAAQNPNVTGKALEHRVLQAEAKVTMVDAVLATATLLGLTLNATKTCVRNAWRESFDFLGYAFGVKVVFTPTRFQPSTRMLPTPGA